MKRYKETRLSEFFRKISKTTSAVTAETAIDTTSHEKILKSIDFTNRPIHVGLRVSIVSYDLLLTIKLSSPNDFGLAGRKIVGYALRVTGVNPGVGWSGPLGFGMGVVGSR